MPRTVWPADAVSGSPSYSGRKLRQAFGVLLGGAKSSRPLGGRSGVRPGSGTLGSVSSFVWTINPHAGALDLESAGAAGPYLYSIDDTSNTGAVTAADATNPRVDIVYLTLNDPAESDGSTTPDVVPGYLAGAPAASPVAPATPARSMVLFTISVPKVGAGSPTVTNAAPYTVAAGAPIPVSSQAERDALSAYEGMRVIRLDNGSTLDTYTGGAWVTGDTGWVSLAVASGWNTVVNYPLQYRVRNGVVFLQGAVSYNSGTTIATLPAGVRPAGNTWLASAVANGTGSFTYNLHVSAAGIINVPAGYSTGSASTGMIVPVYGSFLLG